jgi:myosin V
MQSRKTDADVESVCEICPTLTGAQILKLIKSYTPDDCEDQISQEFIEKLNARLSEIKHNTVSFSFSFVLFIFL